MHAFDFPIEPGPAGSCRVRVGAGALDVLAADLERAWPGLTRVVISDDRVGSLYGEALATRLGRHGACQLLVFPAGELHKTRQTKQALEDELLARGVGRDSLVVALGGGVAGDLAGFVAATWHRGVELIQAPTSLLAMVDACLGGKSAVDLPGGKNLVGAFHQPRAIYADVATLGSLDEQEYRSGFAEVIKTAAIADAELFAWLESNVEPLLARDSDTLEPLVLRCLKLKSDVVAGDARESGRRAMLNFGHTVGHAIETVTGYAVPHGHAVTIGMMAESALALSRGGFSSGDRDRLSALVAAFGLPRELPADTSIDALLEATRRDKKARAGTARYALPAALGSMPPGADVCAVIDEAEVGEVLRSIQQASG